ncbi:MAG TPA: serine--tRNA ligase [Bdellovibrionota bacterium]|jgi:seryl-tRNA synthetase
MLDLRWILENEALLRKKLQARNNFPTDALDRVVASDGRRRELIQKVETARARKNAISKDIPQKKKAGEDIAPLMAESTKVGKDMEGFEQELNDLQANMDNDLLQLPNVFDDAVPIGSDEKGNKEIHKRGEPKKFSFTPLDHHDLGVKLGILDFDRATRLATTRFTAILGKGARLSRAIAQFMLDTHTEQHGYKEVVPPYMANTKAFIGTGQLPKFKEDQFKIEGFDLYLIPTSEVSVTNLYREEILDEAKLPMLLTAFSPCFRSEAGSYGKDTRGLIRQHQFEKVELVIFAHPDKSWELHEQLTKNAETILDKLELPYRRMLLCSGDMGFGSAKTYDLEVWLPAQKAYREISSCSNFTDFQARRMACRFKGKEGKPRFVHTLNGSGLAVGRTFVAILENYQQEDGSVLIPKVLQKYTGFDRIEAPHS